MNKILIIFLTLSSFVFSQKYEDVVILKNGSEIQGQIIEYKPNGYIKIQSGENIFVYQLNEIELFKRLPGSSKKSKDGGYLYIGPSIGMFGGLDIGYGSEKLGRIYLNSQLAFDWDWGDLWWWLIVNYEKPILISENFYFTPSVGIGTSVVGGLNFEFRKSDFFHLKFGAKQGLDFIDGAIPFCATITFGFAI